MSRRPANFQQCDLDRAIRAAKKAGLSNYEVVIEGPRVIVRVTSNPPAADNPVANSEEIVL
jgi:hypothetical protein